MLADLAAVFHWPLDNMKRMPISELLDYRKLAVERSGAERTR